MRNMFLDTAMPIFHLPALRRCNGNGLSMQPAQKPSWVSIASTNGTTQSNMAAVYDECPNP